MQYLSIDQILYLHESLLEQSGGMEGVRDQNGLESAIAQPEMAFGGIDLYPTIEDKAAASGFSLVMNHPFFDGNKRVGYIAIVLFLKFNGFELTSTVDDAEQTILKLAAGELKRDELVSWIKEHMHPATKSDE